VKTRTRASTTAKNKGKKRQISKRKLPGELAGKRNTTAAAYGPTSKQIKEKEKSLRNVK